MPRRGQTQLSLTDDGRQDVEHTLRIVHEMLERAEPEGVARRLVAEARFPPG